MGWGSFFLMLSVICIIVFAFVYRYLPETLGLSLENMIDYFAELTNDNFVLEAEAKINEGRRDSEVELVENDTPMAEMPEIIWKDIRILIMHIIECEIDTKLQILVWRTLME